MNHLIDRIRRLASVPVLAALCAAMPVRAQSAPDAPEAPYFCNLANLDPLRASVCSAPALWEAHQYVDQAMVAAVRDVAALPSGDARVADMKTSQQRFEETLSLRCEPTNVDCLRVGFAARVTEIGQTVQAMHRIAEAEAAERKQQAEEAARQAEQKRMAAELAEAKARAAAAEQAAAEEAARQRKMLVAGLVAMGLTALGIAAVLLNRRRRSSDGPVQAAPIAAHTAGNQRGETATPTAPVAVTPDSGPGAAPVVTAPEHPVGVGKPVLWLRHPVTGDLRRAPWGFSWTMLLFGPLVPIWRRDGHGFALMMILGVCTGGISNIVLAFVGNRYYIKRLVRSGYQACAVETGTLSQAGSVVGLPVPVLDGIDPLTPGRIGHEASGEVRRATRPGMAWALGITGFLIVAGVAGKAGQHGTVERERAEAAATRPVAQPVAIVRQRTPEEAIEDYAEMIERNGRMPCQGIANHLRMINNNFGAAHPAIAEVLGKAEQYGCL